MGLIGLVAGAFEEERERGNEEEAVKRNFSREKKKFQLKFLQVFSTPED